MQERRRRIANILGVALGVVLVIGFGLGRVMGGAPTPPASCDDPTSWDQAGDHVGRDAAVAGPVADVRTVEDVGGAPTFVNLGNPHPEPERFDIVIYEDVRAEFETAPQSQLDGQDVCVVGRVRERDGVPQIVLDAAWSIEVR